MAVNPLIPTWISYARISEYLDANRKALRAIFNGGSVVPDYVEVLEMVRTSVEWAYGQNPNDETLNVTGAYMYSLIDANAAANVIAGNACTPVFIAANPISQTITSGGNVTFSVLAGGTASFTYQWQKDGSSITGATSASYTINGATSGDAGSYRVVVSNPCGTIASAAATLTVNAAPVSVFASYGDIDPNTDLQAHVDSFTYQITTSVVHNSPVSINVPVGVVNKFWVVKVPSTESDKTTWYSTPLNNGTIVPPDSVFQAMITFGGFDYYYTRVAATFDPVPLILS